MNHEIATLADRVLRSLMRHRERYLRAWIAATGLHPLEAELVEELYPPSSDGVIRTRVYVRRRNVTLVPEVKGTVPT